METTIIFLVSCLCMCHTERITHVSWWWANLKSQDMFAEEIDGSYRIAIRDVKKPEFQIFRKNSELLLKRITQFNWYFRHADFLDDDMLPYENINLVLEGVDTLGSIHLNSEEVGLVDNMFIPHIFNIKHCYKKDYNKVAVTLFPLIKQALYQYGNYSTKIAKLYPECLPQSFHGQCHIFMLRTQQSCFGSTIGPPLPSVGVWRPTYIEGYNETTIRDISTNIVEKNDSWMIDVSVYFANNTRGVLNGQVDFNILDAHFSDSVIVMANKDGEFVYTKSLNILKASVDLWWPVGYGEQKLYDLKIEFSSGKGETVNRSLRIGFRKIELIQDKVGELNDQGQTFYFKVNGRPIFMKGAVMAPIHLQPELAQDIKRIKNLFSLALTQHMNMIRVWGGGLYQVDKFYELADEMGLMIWQDFMFLDMSYPTSTRNLTNVMKEVRYQTRRLNNHPSVIVFCGNDEGEMALAENRYDQNKSKTVQDDYLKLFDQTIKSEFLKVTNGKGIFLSSTPSNSEASIGNIADNPNSIRYGDVHFFDYANDPFKHSTYPTPRFVSAYGFQSFPKVESFLKDTNDVRDLDLEEKFLHNRQHLQDGYGIMKKLIAYQIVLKTSEDKEKYIKAFSYYSQVIQAYATRIQTEKYRSYRSINTSDALGYTMGALYWHLNDVWTAPTWSGMDYFGEWKMMQYYVKDFFNPIIVTGQLENNENGKTSLNIFVVSDINSIEKADVKLKLGRWDDLGTFNETSFAVTVEADSSKLVTTIADMKTFFSQRNCTKEDCFIYLTLESNQQAIAPANFILPNPLKNSKLGQPTLSFHLKKLPFKQIYEITVTTDINALFVWLDAHEIDGKFSENGFLLLTQIKKVFFYSSIDTSEDELREKLTVIHVKDKRLI